MGWIAGVDGCPGGWFRVCRETQSGQLRFDLVDDVRALLSQAPHPTVVALDMPIGLPEAHDRACDKAARQAIGKRKSSVFTVPVRATLKATDREEASALTQAADGRKLSVQTWGIFPKICSVDAAMADDPAFRAAVCEVHPEVSFWAWNQGRAMEHPKKKGGLPERLALARAWLGQDILRQARGPHLKKHLADDDILDAIACLWTAQRISEGRAQSFPESPPLDATGLPMQIVF